MEGGQQFRSKYFCLTINENAECFWELYTSFEYMDDFFDTEDPTVTYFCGQREIGEAGNVHLQCYVEYALRVRMRQVRSMFPGAHIERRLGTAEEAAKYCLDETKRRDHPDREVNHVEYGQRSITRQGARTDMERLKGWCKRKRSYKEISEEFFGQWLRYEKGIRSYCDLRAEPREDRTETWILYGPSGTGKSTLAFQYAMKNHWTIFNQDGSQWWDGYDGEECIIVDEFDGEWSYRFWKLLCDRQPLKVPVKGGYRQFKAKCVIFTSNIGPFEW